MDEILKVYPDMLDVKDVSRILNVSEGTIRNLIKNNKMPYIKIGNITRIPKSDLKTTLLEKKN